MNTTEHHRHQRLIRISTAAAALAAGGVLILGGGMATAGTGSSSATSITTPEEADVAITGSALGEASAAALAHTGDGVVTTTEIGDEDSYYEVEVTLSSGAEVDVQLDDQFVVVGSESEVGSADQTSGAEKSDAEESGEE